MVCLIIALPAAAQGQPAPTPASPDPAAIRRGDAVVTGFAGTLPPGPDLPEDIHPLDRTQIDVEGITVRVFDLSELGGGPSGQVSDAPVKLAIQAKDIGHVFGVAFDGDGTAGPPNIYLTATSVHGLQLVAPTAQGRLERIMTGRPGAQWMPGLFGDARGGGPGSIWKVDGKTGIVTLFADIRTGDLENSGASLGAIAFDPRSRHLYVSDLETGLVWRLDLEGRIIDVFDHGTQGRAAAGLPFAAYDPQTRTDRTEGTFNTEIPETWGFAPPERRVWALAIEGGRLYYSVADGPKVWSVGLNPDGSFATDARLEIDITGTPAGNQVSSILFDGPLTLYLAQRGTQLGSYDFGAFMRPQESMAMRYTWNEAERRWSPAHEEYAVGLPPEHHGTVGGLALNYGYDRFGNIDYGRCRQTLWLTGEHLRAGSDIQRVSRGGPRLVDGLQGIYKSRVRPGNEPPFEAWYVDFDAAYSDTEAHGHVGNVAIFGPCAPAIEHTAERVEIPVWTSGPNIVVEKRCYPGLLGGRIRCVIAARNTGDAPAVGVVEIVEETRTLWGPATDELIPIAEVLPDTSAWRCETLASGAVACGLDASVLAPGGAWAELTVWIDTRDLVLAGNLGFRNCVAYNHAAGKGKACAEGGTDIVVTKTAPRHCKPGEDCKFELTLTNRSASPFDGELLLADHLFIGPDAVKASISEIEPPLGCAKDPTTLPFSCLAKVKLAPGASRKHTILIEMPEKSPVWAANCFAAFDPALGAEAALVPDLLAPAKFKGKDLPGGQPACAWVKITEEKIVAPAKPPAGSYVPTIASGLLPPHISCPDGRAPLPSGRCACPLSAPWDPATQSCRWRPFCWDKARLRPDGACCPRGEVWWPQWSACRVPPIVGCHDVWRRKPDGGCCPAGERWRDGACRPPVVAEPCGPGFWRHLSGACVLIPVIPPVVVLPRCPDGRPRLITGRCPTITCPLSAPFNPRTGSCERIVVSPTSCGPGQIRLPASGKCVTIGSGCPAGLQRNGAGHCVPPGLATPTGPNCGPGQHNIGGKCIGVALPTPGTQPPLGGQAGGCPGILVKDASGKCMPPGLAGGGKGPPVACGPGQTRVGGACIGATPPLAPVKGVPIVPPKPPVVTPPEVKVPPKPPVVVPPVVKVPVKPPPPVEKTTVVRAKPPEPKPPKEKKEKKEIKTIIKAPLKVTPQRSESSKTRSESQTPKVRSTPVIEKRAVPRSFQGGGGGGGPGGRRGN